MSLWSCVRRKWQYADSGLTVHNARSSERRLADLHHGSACRQQRTEGERGKEPALLAMLLAREHPRRRSKATSVIHAQLRLTRAPATGSSHAAASAQQTCDWRLIRPADGTGCVVAPADSERVMRSTHTHVYTCSRADAARLSGQQGILHGFWP